jgi:thiamine biosynthesis protein ThiS
VETLKVNGAEKEFPDGLPATVAELMKVLGVNAATVVAEIEGQIIQREMFAETKLQSGQSVELVRFVGGG